MRAVLLRGAGPGARLAVEDVAPPRAPRGEEVLVRVRACSLNGTDAGGAQAELVLVPSGRAALAPPAARARGSSDDTGVAAAHARLGGGVRKVVLTV